MLRFTVFGWHVSARVYRRRKVSRADLEQAGVIVCGPDVEQRMVEESRREMHEYEVMSDLYRAVNENVSSCISDFFEAGDIEDRKLAQTRVLEFLRDIRDIAGRMNDQPSAPAGMEE